MESGSVNESESPETGLCEWQKVSVDTPLCGYIEWLFNSECYFSYF